MIPSVNYHLWQACNMRCKFCFATFQDVISDVLPDGHLSKAQSLELITILASQGFQKITFVGGEPTLCPWLDELVGEASQCGMSTMIVSNGALIPRYLKRAKHIPDWIALSIDSLSDTSNLSSGRALNGTKVLTESKYSDIISSIRSYGIQLKINTVVNKTNFTEDFSAFIQEHKPKRWKVLQALEIRGQNDQHFQEMSVLNQQFHDFVSRHNHLANYTTIVPESNSEMVNSYVMIDPAGRFFINRDQAHTYSSSILNIGVKAAYSQMNYELEKFLSRGGLYGW